MKQINLTFYICILLFISNIYLLLRKGLPSQPVVEVYKGSGKGEKDQSGFRSMFYDNYASIILPNEGRAIKMNAKIQDTLFVKNTLASVINSKRTLLFRYSYSDCEGCIEMVLKRFKKNNDLNTIIITDSYDEKDFLIKTRNQNYGQKIYSLVERENLGLPLEGKGLPFLCLIEDGKTKYFYTPYKEYPDQFNSYVDFVESVVKEKN
jgi:hypothetical protein